MIQSQDIRVCRATIDWDVSCTSSLMSHQPVEGGTGRKRLIERLSMKNTSKDVESRGDAKTPHCRPKARACLLTNVPP